jgi:hypothetical protein
LRNFKALCHAHADSGFREKENYGFPPGERKSIIGVFEQARNKIRASESFLGSIQQAATFSMVSVPKWRVNVTFMRFAEHAMCRVAA